MSRAKAQKRAIASHDRALAERFKHWADSHNARHADVRVMLRRAERVADATLAAYHQRIPSLDQVKRDGFQLHPQRSRAISIKAEVDRARRALDDGDAAAAAMAGFRIAVEWAGLMHAMAPPPPLPRHDPTAWRGRLYELTPAQADIVHLIGEADALPLSNFVGRGKRWGSVGTFKKHQSTLNARLATQNSPWSVHLESGRVIVRGVTAER